MVSFQVEQRGNGNASPSYLNLQYIKKKKNLPSHMMIVVCCKTRGSRDIGKTIHYQPISEDSYRYHDLQRCKLWRRVGELYGTGGFVFGLLGCHWVVNLERMMMMM
jgi:hypothetical protein